jgi:hypothetical protein
MKDEDQDYDVDGDGCSDGSQVYGPKKYEIWTCLRPNESCGIVSEQWPAPQSDSSVRQIVLFPVGSVVKS